MEWAQSSKLVVLALLTLLLSAIVAFAALYSRENRPLVAPHEQPFVERAGRDAAAAFGETPEAIARASFPVVIKLSDRTCVELRPIHRHDGGYLACYDTRTNRMVEERVSSAAFGG